MSTDLDGSEVVEQVMTAAVSPSTSLQSSTGLREVRIVPTST